MRGRIGGIVGLIVFMACAVIARASLPVTLEDIQKVVPRAASFDHKLEPLDHYTVKDATGTVVGVAYLTSKIAPEIRGYHGEIDILVGMDLSGTIAGVTVLSHNENEEYMKMIVPSGFLRKFIGRSMETGLDDIEAITGATISSEAIKRDIQTATHEITTKLIDSDVIMRETGAYSSPFGVLPTLAVILLIGGVFAATFMPRKRLLRYAVWIASVAVVGFWLNTPITIGTFVDIRNGAIPFYMPLLILFGFALVAAMMKGNLYCAYLCPFGALQECAIHVKMPRIRPTERAVRNAGWLRWIILILTVSAIASGVDAFRTIEPYSLSFKITYQPEVWIQSGVVLIAALFLTRPWCRYFCPTGVILDLVAQLSRKVRRRLRLWLER